MGRSSKTSEYRLPHKAPARLYQVSNFAYEQLDPSMLAGEYRWLLVTCSSSPVAVNDTTRQSTLEPLGVTSHPN